MTLKTRLDNCLGASILLVGDSITGNQTYMYPYRVAELLAARYPTSRVEFHSLSTTGPTVTTVIQTGSAQTIHVYRDGIPGSTSYRADNSAYIFSYPVDLVSIFLGVNDAVNFGLSSTYTPSLYKDNLTYMSNYACQNLGCEVVLITPAWSEYVIGTNVAAAAAITRLVARKNNHNLVDARRIFEDHYTGTGNAGQGTGDNQWFADPNDPTHFGREGHYAIADEFMRMNGWV